ncbi:MAG: acyl-CoA thioesterase [Chloroflexota bacterium]|nr:MAG: acyl-CoA thioesterase [Chloroflexota bacterium]
MEKRGSNGRPAVGGRTPTEASPSPSSWHQSAVRVRYEETDAMGYVYHANYLRYFEVGRVEYLRAHRAEYRGWEQRGLAAPVVESSCHHHAPAYFDDLLLVRTRVVSLRRASFVLEYQIVRESDGCRIVSGSTRHACVDRFTGRPLPLPADLQTALRDDLSEDPRSGSDGRDPQSAQAVPWGLLPNSPLFSRHTIMGT